MSDHLKKKELDSKTIAETIRYLIKFNYIDDERFALDWGKFCAKKKQIGEKRLLKELIHKGISNSLAEKTAAQIFSEFDEWELARACVEKKVQSLHKYEVTVKRRRLAGYLERKGFPPPVIIKALNHFVPFDRLNSTE